jgi:hypothetical protein
MEGMKNNSPSFLEREFEVVNRSDEVEPERKSFAAVSISFRKNSKDFEPANDIFNQNTDMRLFAVAGFLFLGQRMKLRALGRDLAVIMQVTVAQAIDPPGSTWVACQSPAGPAPI